jgi:hypothetical protein
LPPQEGGWQSSSGIFRPHYDYMSSVLAELPWHGGITYYEKSGGLDGGPRYVKAGCDLAHSWDDGRDYDFAYVEQEAHRTINALRERFCLLRRCTWSGAWMPEEQLTQGKHGLYSIEKRAESDRKQAEATMSP